MCQVIVPSFIRFTSNILPRRGFPSVLCSPVPTGLGVLLLTLPTGQCRIIRGRNQTWFLPFVSLFSHTYLAYLQGFVVFFLTGVLGAHRPFPVPVLPIAVFPQRTFILTDLRTVSLVLCLLPCPCGRRAVFRPVVPEGLLDPLSSLGELRASGLQGRGATPRPTDSPCSCSSFIGLLTFCPVCQVAYFLPGLFAHAHRVPSIQVTPDGDPREIRALEVPDGA